MYSGRLSSPRIVTAPWQFPVDFMLVENRERKKERRGEERTERGKEAEIETNDHGNGEWGTNRGQDRVEEVQGQKCRDMVHGREWKREGEKKGSAKGIGVVLRGGRGTCLRRACGLPRKFNSRSLSFSLHALFILFPFFIIYREPMGMPMPHISS